MKQPKINEMKEYCKGCRFYNTYINGCFTASLMYTFPEIEVECPCGLCIIKSICEKSCGKRSNLMYDILENCMHTEYYRKEPTDTMKLIDRVEIIFKKKISLNKDFKYRRIATYEK